MSGDVLALAAGTVLAVGALAVVLQPLFFSTAERMSVRRPPDRAADDSAIAALREIEFDRATGKLSEADYVELKASYTPKALEELRARDAAAHGAPAVEEVDPIEARVRAYRSVHRECPTCGIRPEPDATWCSTCGAFLPGVCPACSAPIREAAAVFCSTCGAALADAAGQVSARAVPSA